MKTRILIVDDSPLIRAVLRETFERTCDMEVVGEAGDGREAVGKVQSLMPDIVTMDVLMPDMDGLQATQSIMRTYPVPILIVARDGGSTRALAMEALGKGALEIFSKPEGGFTDQEALALTTLVRRLARKAGGEATQVYRTAGSEPGRIGRETQGGLLPRVSSSQGIPVVDRPCDVAVVGIGGSTGAPRVISDLLSALPVDFPVPIVVVQHTDRGFSQALVNWLGEASTLPVRMGKDGYQLLPGEVVVAPDGEHMEISSKGRVSLHLGPPECGFRPSVNTLFRSLAASYGPMALGMVLSGMGLDGAEGLGALYAAGGTAVVEDPATATVSGMPQRALEQAAGAYVETADRLALLLLELVAQGRYTHGPADGFGR